MHKGGSLKFLAGGWESDENLPQREICRSHSLGRAFEQNPPPAHRDSHTQKDLSIADGKGDIKVSNGRLSPTSVRTSKGKSSTTFN